MRLRSHLAMLLAAQFTVVNMSYASIGGDQLEDLNLTTTGVAQPPDSATETNKGPDYGYVLMNELQVEKLDLSDLSDEAADDDAEESEISSLILRPDQNVLADNVDISAVEANSTVIMTPGRFWIRDGIIAEEDGQRYVRVELESGYQFWTKLSAFDNAIYVAEGEYAGKASGRVTSKAGWRVHPISGRMKCHEGTDIAYPTGTPVGARGGAGKVAKAGRSRGYGNLVEIHHGGGMMSRYAHLSKISVRVGQKVKAGQIIGRVGCTGSCTGPHLHYEYKKIGTSLCKGKKGKKSKRRNGKKRRK